MTKYGQEVETRYIDENEKVEYVRNIKEFNVHSAYKRVSVRVKVYNKKEETVEYLSWSNLLEKHRQEGTLVRGDQDQNLKPSFIIEYPKHNNDGGYFVIRSFTTVML